MAETPVKPRLGTPNPELTEDEFKKRYLLQFADPAFRKLDKELDRMAAVAWDAYKDGRKAPQTRKAGSGFHDPDYDLSIDWLEAREAIAAARERHDDTSRSARVLLICGSSRSEHTCPGEMSKSYRLVEIAQTVLNDAGIEVDVLEISRLAAEYGRRIYPCKACFSTSPALCHWPCSCYPNHAMGQTQDWMSEIYPRWVAAHGVMIVTPVNWYHASSGLKLMIDRLVCADGGNPDPTSTDGKDAERAKKIELAGWDYPRHLAGRLFSIVVHGDTEGAQEVRRSLVDWLSAMHLIPAGRLAEVARYIGYWEPYATSHDALDKDAAMVREVQNAAKTLHAAIDAKRRGTLTNPGDMLREPRDK